MADRVESGRRFVIATAVTRYAHAPELDQPDLVHSRDRMLRVLMGLGYKHVPDPGLDPTRTQLTDQLHAFCAAPGLQPSDMLALYIAGHGEVLDDGEHVLVTAETHRDMYDALPTAELVRAMLLGTGLRRLLLLLDTCYSGQGGNELAAVALTRALRGWQQDPDSGLVVVSSAQPDQRAMVGAFPALFEDAIGSMVTAGYAPAMLALDAVVETMNQDRQRPGFQRVTLTQAGLTGSVPAFLPNPKHATQDGEIDLAIARAARRRAIDEHRDTEFARRLLRPAMGGWTQGGADDWWFCGRKQALTDIAGWLRRSDGAGPALVVTGGPGSGKSAVLGLVSALAQPRYRPTVPVDGLGLDEAQIPPAASLDASVYARQLTDGQVLEQLCAAAGLDPDTAAGKFIKELEGRREPFVALIDALDEAATPHSLCRDLLRLLLDYGRGRVRLLLGTRPHLLGSLGLDRERSIDLDAERYADLPAMIAYTTRGLLDAESDSPFRDADHGLVRRVATAVATVAMPSFLVARITSGTLAAGASVPDPGDLQWRASLPRVPGTAMRRDLEERLGPHAPRARDLLRPLAWAYGQGLPWEDVWAPLASRLAGRAYTNSDLHWLIDHAASYVVETSEQGRSAYRLYHQALAEYLREDSPAPAAVHTTFTDVLVSRVPVDATGLRDWSRTHPYTRRYLAAHASAAGRIREVSQDPDYLAHAEPDALAAALYTTAADAGTGHGADLAAQVYRDSYPSLSPLLPGRNPPSLADRASVLAVNFARYGALDAAARLTRETGWRIRWATGAWINPTLRGTLTSPLRISMDCVQVTVLNGRAAAVTVGGSYVPAIGVWDLTTGEFLRTIKVPTVKEHRQSDQVCASIAMVDGRPVVIGSVRGGEIWVADPAEGTILRAWSTPQGNTVNSMAIAVLDGRPVALAGCWYEPAQVWDPATGELLRTLPPETRDKEIGAAMLNGRPVAITVAGFGSKQAQAWDLATGECVQTLDGAGLGWQYPDADAIAGGAPIADPGTPSGVLQDMATGETVCLLDRGMASSTVAMVDDRPFAVAVGFNCLKVWDLTGRKAADEDTVRAGAVAGVVTAGEAGRPVALTVHQDSMRVWDLATGKIVRTLSGGGHAATAVLDGRPVLVTTTPDRKSIETWDPATGELLGTITSPSPPTCITTAVLDSRPVAVTGFAYGDGFVVDLRSGAVVSHLRGVQADHIYDVATTVLGGRPVAVTTSADRGSRIAMWDLATGTVLASPWVSTQAIQHLAVTSLDGRPVVVGTCDGKVRVWDPATWKDIQGLGQPDFQPSAMVSAVIGGRPVMLMAAGRLWVWDLAEGTCQKVLTFPMGCGSIAVGPGDTVVLSSGLDIITLELRRADQGPVSTARRSLR